MTVRYDPRPDWSREDRDRATEQARPRLETAVQLLHTVWGYLDEHTHESVTDLELCEAIGQEFLAAESAAELAAEEGYERWLENRGFDDALEQRAWEDRSGVVQFDELGAW